MSAENNYNYIISYGKARVPVYRVYAHPLSGVPSIPESSFIVRENILFAVEVDVEVFGENFLPSYTKGDNSMVVATDTMKNFILRQTLAFEGSTLEGFLEQLGHQFLATYPEMERLRMTGRELAFTPARIPQGGQEGAGKLRPYRPYQPRLVGTSACLRPLVIAMCCSAGHTMTMPWQPWILRLMVEPSRSLGIAVVAWECNYSRSPVAHLPISSVIRTPLYLNGEIAPYLFTWMSIGNMQMLQICRHAIFPASRSVMLRRPSSMNLLASQFNTWSMR